MRQWAPHVTVATVVYHDGRYLLVEEIAEGVRVLNQPAGHLEPRETLIEARDHPERFPDLIVRVAGYSDYFVKLSAAMQEEVIARTEHTM